MIPEPPCKWKWPSLGVLALHLSLAAGSPHTSQATGFYGPDDYLARGGESVVAAPEFYWELEVKRLSRAFRPAEVPRTTPDVFPPRPGDDEFGSLSANMVRPTELTESKDAADFAKAIDEGRIKPPNPAAAQQQHEAARAAIASPTADELPAEFASEFADYHRGAFAFAQGQEHWPEARKAWEALLQRPPAERHDRTVWAAFMLGKLALKAGSAEAPKWFQQARALAHDGFADSLGLAADSYGWEGRSEWKQQHPEKAARLFLTQLSLGDESAVESLKALIPDRSDDSNGVIYSPIGSENWTEEQWNGYRAHLPDELRKMARDPLLRRLMTVHILATETGHIDYGEAEAPKEEESRIAQWMVALKAEGIKETEDAEYLGWAAYQLGDFKGAASWLEKAKGESAAAAWLRSKLLRRGGKLAEAAQQMVLAWKTIEQPNGYTGWQPAPAEPKPPTPPPAAEKTGAPADPADAAEPAEEDAETEEASQEGFSFFQHAGGNMAALQLARGEFLQSFEAFLKSKMWEDAAFVAESILTTDELKTYVDRECPPVVLKKEEEYETPNRLSLRYLLGRRLVREDRYAEAASYLTAPYPKVLERYVQALQAGANEKLPKGERAQAWFHAAWLARYDGMELMGTEVAPDGFVNRGDFELNDIAGERRTGKRIHLSDEEVDKKKPAKAIVWPTSAEEVARLKKHRVAPDVRYHYRVIAAALAMKAAALLPDNAPELADVINTAGEWVKDRDEKAADRYYQELIHRAPRTEIGKSAKAKRWFVDENGAWSDRELDAREAMRKELGLD